MRLASNKNKNGKNMLFFQPNFSSILARVYYRKKLVKKTRSKILWGFAIKLCWGLPHVQYYCGILFRYQKNIPRVWSTSGHYVHTTAGYFFEKCPKFRPKWPKICERYRLYEPKCCSVWVQQKKNKLYKIFLYASTLSHYKGYLPERFPATGKLWRVS